MTLMLSISSETVVCDNIVILYDQFELPLHIAANCLTATIAESFIVTAYMYTYFSGIMVDFIEDLLVC